MFCAAWRVFHGTQALLEVVDSGAKNMEIAIVRKGKANEVRPLLFSRDEFTYVSTL